MRVYPQLVPTGFDGEETMQSAAASSLEVNEERRRWAMECAVRTFSEMEAGTDICGLAKDIEEYAKTGEVPKEAEKA
jgi:hypothetical protein